MKNKQFSNKSGNRPLISIFRVAFLIYIFSAFSFAQISEKLPAKLDTVAPKVTKIDETSISEILKPNGKPLLVNFWATWCVPCREEFPDLVKISKEYEGKINVITISLDDLAEINRDVPKFLIEMKAEMPTYLLYTNKESEVISSISKDWQGGLPFSILYDGKGEIVHTKQGKIKPEVVKAKINDILTTKTVQVSINELPRSEIRSNKEGKEDAKNDIAAGILKIKRYGLTAAIPQNSIDEIKKKYGIEITESGCVLINTTSDYFKAYNEVMKAEISKIFGVEVLEKLPF